MAYEKDPDEIGALWVKSGAKGDYMTGTILGQPVVVFAANGKSPKAPQWRVLKAKPRDQAASARPSNFADDEVPF